MRYFIEITYQGQEYHGWQIQQNANTVQQEVNQAFSKYCGYAVETVGSGRTDTGVHALQQYCHLDLIEQLNIPKAIHKLNAILPPDISLNNIYQVPDDAHARFHAISRSYEYHISKIKNPFIQNTSYYFRTEVALPEMNDACLHLIGEKDFKSFCRVKTSVDNFICAITQAHWEAHNGTYCFYVSANRFLRGMVRAIVGTLLEVGTGKLTVQQFENIVTLRDRRKAGRSVPAKGLFLTKVVYPDQLLKME